MTTLLIAGSGYVGATLAALARGQGWRVIALRRSRARSPLAGVETIVGDLTDPASLMQLPRVDKVAFTAAAGESSDEAYQATYVRGLGHLLTALGRQGPATDRPEVLFVSSTGVFGQDDGSWVDESSVTAPAHFSGRRLLEAESLALGGPLRSCVLRLGGIYGPTRTRMIDLVAAGEATIDPNVLDYTNRLHVDDCASAIFHLLALPADARAPIYIGCDTEPVDKGTLFTWLARSMGLPPPPLAAATTGAPPRPRNKRCSSARLAASGYRFRYPTYREGFSELLGERLLQETPSSAE